MYKERKNLFDKLNDLVEIRRSSSSSSKAFPLSYDGDFVSNLPLDSYVDKLQKVPNGKVYDVREYGAVPNDENRLAHGAINGVIDICSKNGGGIVLVSGGDFHCQTIVLRSNVTLFVDKGSRLVASKASLGYRHGALVFCENSTNVHITGGGKIFGNGNSFSLAPESQPLTVPPPFIDIVEMEKERRATSRLTLNVPYISLISFSHCSNVSVDNFVLENSGYLSVLLYQCNNGEIKNTVVNNNRHILKTDGFLLMQSSNIRIENCFVSTGGNGICFKNAVWLGCSQHMSNVFVTGCEIQSKSSAFKIGDETTNNITDVIVENCKFSMTDVFPGTVNGVSIVSCDGSEISSVHFKGIEMDRVVCPVFLRLCNRNRAYDIDENERSIELNAKILKRLNPKEVNVFDWQSQLRDISFENVSATNAEMPIVIAGTFDVKRGTKYIENVFLKNVNVHYKKSKEVYEKRTFIPEFPKGFLESWEFKNLPAYGIWARHVNGLQFSNFSCVPAKATWKDRAILEDIKNLSSKN